MPAPAVNWRRNLVALAVTNFTGILGITAMIPFVAFFLARDLGVHRPQELALWTGGAAAASGLGQALAGTLWGALGDRFGRKPLLLRALIMGGGLMALTSLSRSPQQLLGFRFAFGLLAGPLPIAMAIVASETPRAHVARALGILNAAISLASAIGPALGSVVASLVDVRYVFALAGGAMLVSSVFVVVLVRESPRGRHREASPPAAAPRSGLRGGLLRTVVLLLAAQALASTVATMVLPLMSLRFLELAPGRAASITGAAFAVSGVMTAIAGVLFGSVLLRLGYRRTAIASALVTAGALGVVGGAAALAAVIAAFAVYGLMQGVLNPVLASVMGVEVPARLHSTVFGMSASALAVGYTVGPLLAGGVAALASVSTSLELAGAVALGLAVLLGARLAEPRPAASA